MNRALSKKDQLAKDILLLSRNTLLVHLRFLDAALNQLSPVPGSGSLAVDGESIYYDAHHIFQVYRAEREQVTRDFLHMVLHCVFRHNFISPDMDTFCWDLACDLAVEQIITELNLSITTSSRQKKQKSHLERIQQEAGGKTAERLYHYLMKQEDRTTFEDIAALFKADDHSLWYNQNQEEGDEEAGQDSSPGDGQSQGTMQPSSTQETSFSLELESIWKDISERMQMEMETFSKFQGTRTGSLSQNLREVNRERYDYTSFLKKFSVMGEAMKVNEDEFDYIFYTYGLKLYEKMPLIEPLEYKEVKRIKEFVIAIDTSGSVSGPLVQKFIQKTYNILKQEESFFTKINLHIIQCDTEIREDAKITSQKEFDQYLKNMTLKGFGGTDFRPVFQYVNQLAEKREFTNLKGLIYFTDGYGTFPKIKPAYETAFVFVEEGDHVPEIPPWAIRLILRPNEI